MFSNLKLSTNSESGFHFFFLIFKPFGLKSKIVYISDQEFGEFNDGAEVLLIVVRNEELKQGEFGLLFLI